MPNRPNTSYAGYVARLVPYAPDWLCFLHPEIASQIVWTDTSGTTTDFCHWTGQQQTDFFNAFTADWNWYEHGYQGSDFFPVGVNQATDGSTTFTPTDAWHYYVDSVALTIASEMGHWFGWTLRFGDQDQVRGDGPGHPQRAAAVAARLAPDVLGARLPRQLPGAGDHGLLGPHRDHQWRPHALQPHRRPGLAAPEQPDQGHDGSDDLRGAGLGTRQPLPLRRRVHDAERDAVLADRGLPAAHVGAERHHDHRSGERRAGSEALDRRLPRNLGPLQGIAPHRQHPGADPQHGLPQHLRAGGRQPQPVVLSGHQQGDRSLRTTSTTLVFAINRPRRTTRSSRRRPLTPRPSS